MCGITGIISANENVDRSLLTVACDFLKHRGPDSSGEWWSSNGRVGLAHRRLAIIDLSENGRQPMLNREQDLCITFNGEIYNFFELRDELKAKGYTFSSRSDTEVLLACYKEWGTDFLPKLNGMFAFALYDVKNNTVFFARDRAGEKPLFYLQENGGLRFSSELKSLIGHPSSKKIINPEALDYFLAEGYIPGSMCIIDGMHKLPPAHAMLFDLNKSDLRIWKYWNLPRYEGDNILNEYQENLMLDELEYLLEDAVSKQLIGDVPVGVLLSGGVDSSLITAMAFRANSNIKTFTVCFPGQKKYDERGHAKLIAEHFSTEHTELEAEEGTIDMLPFLATQFDEPIIDSSMIPTYLVSKLIRRHCTVALGGDGGDELFGGYTHYSRLLWLEQKFGSVPLFARKIIAGTAEHVLPLGYKGRNWLQAAGEDFNEHVPLIATYFDQRARKKLANLKPVAEQIRRGRLPVEGDLLQRATRNDFENYMPEDILVKVDRASMLNSLEVRAPMLDYRLIEFAFGKVPSSLKATSGKRKVLLKQLTARLLPPEFDQHRKQGFSIPINSWLRDGTWNRYFREVLLDPSQTLFDHEYINQLFNGLKKGHNNSERLFGLVMFQLWYKQYGIN